MVGDLLWVTDCMKDGFPLGKFLILLLVSSRTLPVKLQHQDKISDSYELQRLLDLCISIPSLLIAPDYRLLPEANGVDILSDLEDFWQWLHNSLPDPTKN